MLTCARREAPLFEAAEDIAIKNNYYFHSDAHSVTSHTECVRKKPHMHLILSPGPKREVGIVYL